MASAALKQTEVPVPVVELEQEQRFLLSGIDFQTYEAIGELLRDRPIRMTYDRGTLEFMTTSGRRERFNHIIARLLELLSLEMDIDIAGGGSTTFKREILEKGMEPDECYWVQNERSVRGRDNLDLEVDPPPDLVIEVEISRSVLDRLGILASLGVPEVWRCDAEAIRILHLRRDRTYAEAERSLAFPFLPVSELLRFFQMRATLSDSQLMREFQKWVRAQVATGWPTAPNVKKKSPRKKR